MPAQTRVIHYYVCLGAAGGKECEVTMYLNRIHYFFKAVEYKNFTQAANACHIGQTTMSKYIAVLEQELQTQLFIREHRTLTLTKQGKQFYEGMKK